MMSLQYSAELLLRILCALLAGSLIGLEREGHGKSAGFKTHGLVAMSAAIFTVVSLVGFPNSPSNDRIAAQIVTGIGFMGAGVIYVRRNTLIKGLTTAAGLWATCAIGMLFGTGWYLLAASCLVLILLYQWFAILIKRHLNPKLSGHLTLVYTEPIDSELLSQNLRAIGIHIEYAHIVERYDQHDHILQFDIDLPESVTADEMKQVLQKIAPLKRLDYSMYQ